MIRIQKSICCPICKGELVSHAEKQPEHLSSSNGLFYLCELCDLKYPVVDGVVDFLPTDTGKKKFAQKAMESAWVVKIYEGKWWRANKISPLFTGISLDHEIALIKKIAAICPADTVLDLACGPGLYARSFAEEYPACAIIGLDISWPMLKYGIKKAKRLGMRDLTFLHANAQTLPFKDASIDVVNCGNALHLFTDFRRVLGELRRVIKPGGRVTIAVYLVHSAVSSRMKACLDEAWCCVHYFRANELQALLCEYGFDPTIYHAKGIWMIAGGVRRLDCPSV